MPAIFDEGAPRGRPKNAERNISNSGTTTIDRAASSAIRPSPYGSCPPDLDSRLGRSGGVGEMESAMSAIMTVRGKSNHCEMATATIGMITNTAISERTRSPGCRTR